MTQRNPLPQARRRHRRARAVALCLLACPLAHAAGVKVEVRGVDEELRANVLVYLSFERYKKGGADLNPDTIERLHNRVEREVQSALRPFGYYEPQVDSSVSDLGHGDWRVIININPGKPVLVAHIDVRVDGPGENDPLFQRILRHLPLHDGERPSTPPTRASRPTCSAPRPPTAISTRASSATSWSSTRPTAKRTSRSSSIPVSAITSAPPA